MIVVLIGYRGTGKSTVARHLALRLGCEWVDADVEIELRAGDSIRALFEEHGEAGFREQEAAVLKELLERERIVVAAGGGVVLRKENRELLKRTDQVVWLTADPETLLDRIASDATSAARRPSLTVAGGLTEVRQLLAEREPLYAECADYQVDTVGRTPDEVAAEIQTRLKSQDKAS